MKRWLPWIGVYTLWRLALFAISAFGQNIVAFRPDFTAHILALSLRTPAWIWKFANFDGMMFLTVAAKGYSAEMLPFFPLFPTAVRTVSHLTAIEPITAAVGLNTVLFLLALFVTQRLLHKEGWSVQKQLWFLVVMLAFPTSIYYTAVYNDSLFLLLATTTLLLGRNRQWWLASCVAAVAAVTRLNGQALFVFLAVEYLLSFGAESARWQWRKWGKSLQKALKPGTVLRSGAWTFALVPLAFLSYLGWIEWQFGSWRLFFDGVKVWHRSKLTFPLQTLWRYAKMLFWRPQPSYTYTIVWIEAIATFFYGLLLWKGWRHLRPSYWAFFLVSVLIPMSTGTLQGMPRYGLHIFPLFLLLSGWVANQRWPLRTAYFAVSLTLFFLCALYFTQGYFVS